VIEVIFTGVYSFFKGDKKGTSTTFIWMWIVYGLAGVVLELVKTSLDWPWYLKPLVYTPLIYGIEGLSGLALRAIIGVCPWDYNISKWTFLRVVHFGYLPAWLGLAFLVDPISNVLGKIIRMLALSYGSGV